MRLTFLLTWFCSFSVFAQERVVYSEDFLFEDGIYLDFQDFKNNIPIRLEYLLTDLDIRNPNYIDRVVEKDTITYFDNLFEEREVLTENIWGFAKDGIPHVAHNLVWNRPRVSKEIVFPIMKEIGQYCFYSSEHFTSAWVQSIGLIAFPNRTFTADDDNNIKEQVYMLMDFGSGQIIKAKPGLGIDLMVERVYILLQSDKKLLRQFASLSYSQQKKQSMFFIKRYNDAHPVSFPKR